MNRFIITKLIEELGGEGELTRGIQIELRPNIFYCQYQFIDRKPKPLIRQYDDNRILKELKVLTFIIRWQDKRGANYQIPKLFRQYLKQYGLVEIYNKYKMNMLAGSIKQREEIEIFEREWNYLIKKIKKENRIK